MPQHPKTHRTRVTEHRLHLALRRAAGAASAVAAHRGPPGQHGPGALQTHVACGRKHVRGSVSRGNTRVSHESSTRVT